MKNRKVNLTEDYSYEVIEKRNSLEDALIIVSSLVVISPSLFFYCLFELSK
jgi:hypothetical protein